jgi:hypothetical protein
VSCREYFWPGIQVSAVAQQDIETVKLAFARLSFATQA